MQIQGTIAVVTGAASGLGRATAQRLVDQGAQVILIDRDEAQGAAAAAAMGAPFMAVDVTNAAAVTAAFATLTQLHGTARILVNCAGIAPSGKVIARDGAVLPLGDFAKVIEVNLMGTFNVLARFAGHLCAIPPQGEERGVIINTASIAAFDGQIGQSAYAASKAGVVGLTLPLAREFARVGIRVNTVAPGIFLTPMVETMPPEVQASLGAAVPFPPRLGKPAEFAQLVAAIIENPMLNGETIRLDGAIRMAPK